MKPHHHQDRFARNPENPPSADATLPADAIVTDFETAIKAGEQTLALPESQPSSLADTIAPVDVARPPADSGVGARVHYFGEYQLLHEIARGGMGVVYKARQVKLNRIVALKMILSGQLAGSEAVQRFHSEAEAAASLDHPGIVPIYEIGEHEGQHYFSMGFVDGQSLQDKLRAGPLAPREAAELTLQIVQAVAYAHDRDVIHRDLKPANVLLDGDGQAKVTDFGLAKRITDDSGLTRTGAVMGTPSYMPPEQAAGKMDQVDRRSDVYSLGAVLYCMLTMRPPFQADSPLGTLRQVLELEPVAPAVLNSQVPKDLETICLKCLQKDANRRYATADELVEELQRFLQGVPILARPVGRVERAWRWSKRNPIVAGLIAAVVLAMAIGTGGSTFFAVQAGQQAERNRVIGEQEKAARLTAQRQLRVATARRIVSDSMLAREQWPLRSMVFAAAAVEQAAQTDDATRLAARQNLCNAFSAIGGTPLPEVTFGDFSGDDRWAVVVLRDGSTQLWDLSQDDPLAAPIEVPTPDGNRGARESALIQAAFSRDGRWLAMGYENGNASLWELSAGHCIFRHVIEGHDGAVGVQFDDASHWLIMTSGRRPDESNDPSLHFASVQMCNVQGADPSFRTLDARSKRFLAIDSAGTQLLTCSASEGTTTVDLLDLQSDDARPRSVPVGDGSDSPSKAAFSSDGRWLVTTTPRMIQLHDLAEPNTQSLTLLEDEKATFYQPLFSTDGRWLIVTHLSNDQNTLSVYDLTAEDPSQSIQPLLKVSETDRKLRGDAKLLGDGRWLALGEGSRIVLLWDLSQSDPWTMPRRIVTGHRQVVMGMQVSSDGRWLYTGGGKTVRRWDLSADEPSLNPSVFRGHDETSYMTVSGSGRWIFTFDEGGAWRLWDVQQQDATDFCTVLRNHQEPLWAAPVLASSGASVATVAYDGACRLWDLDAANPALTSLPIGQGQGPLRMMAMADHGRQIALATADHIVRLWTLQPNGDFAETGQLEGHQESIAAIAFHPDASLLATSSNDNTVRIWRLDASGNGSQIKILGGDFSMGVLRFSADGRWLLTAGDGQLGSLWPMEAGEFSGQPIPIRHEYLYSDQNLSDALFSPDGRWLFTASSDHTVRRWDLTAARINSASLSQYQELNLEQLIEKATREMGLVILRGHGSCVTSIALSADGRWLASGSWDNTARLWDLTSDITAIKSFVLRGHDEWVLDVAFSPNSNWLATAGDDNDIRLWDLTIDNPAVGAIVLRGHEKAVWGLAFSHDNRWLVSTSEDTTVRRWNIRWNELQALATRQAGRGMTTAEKQTYGLDSLPQ